MDTFPGDVLYPSRFSGAENKWRASSIVWTAPGKMSRWSKRKGWTVAEALLPVQSNVTLIIQPKDKTELKELISWNNSLDIAIIIRNVFYLHRTFFLEMNTVHRKHFSPSQFFYAPFSRGVWKVSSSLNKTL